jgi:hypothetical protein
MMKELRPLHLGVDLDPSNEGGGIPIARLDSHGPVAEAGGQVGDIWIRAYGLPVEQVLNEWHDGGRLKEADAEIPIDFMRGGARMTFYPCWRVMPVGAASADREKEPSLAELVAESYGVSDTAAPLCGDGANKTGFPLGELADAKAPNTDELRGQPLGARRDDVNRARLGLEWGPKHAPENTPADVVAFHDFRRREIGPSYSAVPANYDPFADFLRPPR